MQRAIVTAVKGTRIFADGRWLTAIGNKPFRPGEFVWTDGRCVYGSSPEGGGAAPIIVTSESYVPILMGNGTRAVYHKGKITKYEKGQRHTLMASQGNSFIFADGKVLDLYLDEQGNQYALQWGEYSYRDFGDGDICEEQDGQIGVTVNGHMKYAINLKEYSKFCYDYALEEAAVIETPLSGVGDVINKVQFNSCTLVNGWYESEKSYCYLIDAYARGYHIDAINYHGEGEADTGFVVNFDSYLWVMVTPKGIQPLWAMTVRAVDDDDEFHIERYRYRIYTSNFTMLLPGGYYIEGAKAVSDNIVSQDYWRERFLGKLYSPQKQMICKSHFFMNKPIRLGRVKNGVWLMTSGTELYLLKGGRQKLLSADVHNSRLHSMKNRTKWMKGDWQYGTY